MVNQNRINQVINAIKANGIQAFDDEGLIRILGMLNLEELDGFEMQILIEFADIDAYDRVKRIKPVVLANIVTEVQKVEESPFFKEYQASLQTGKYLDFFKDCSVAELVGLRKYIENSFGITHPGYPAATKLLKLISEEIRSREDMKKSPLLG